jgi:hypothetical protein
MKRIDKILITATLILLVYGVQVVYADLTATEGFAIDMSSAGAGTDFTVAFDPTEITGGTTWDDGGDASVIWTWDLTAGDPTLTFGNALITASGTIAAGVGYDVTGAADMDLGSADVLDITLVEDGGTYIFNNGLTAVGEDLGSTTAEWNDLFLNDAGTIWFGNDQDVSFVHVADTGLQMALDDSIMFGDTAVFIESDDDGYLDLDADTGIRLNAATTVTGLITGTAGVNLGTSQALLGTTAITIGNNGQTVAINSSDWDIDATGIATGMGNITSNGTIEATAHTQGGQAMYDADDVPGGELGGTFASFTIDDSVTVTGWVLGTSSATQLTSPTLITNLLDTTGAADMDYGSLDVLDHTFITDGVGTAEIVLPAGSIDGTEILDDTIDSADYAAASIDNEHLADDAVDSDEIAAGAIDDAHIADDTIQEPALNVTNAPGDNQVLSYNLAGTNFTWVDAGAGDMTKAVYDSGDSGGVDVLTTVDSTYASDYVLLTGTAVGTAAPKTDGGLTYNSTTANLATTTFTGALTGNADTATTASAGDAAVDFFGAGVDAVTDATTCTDIEGTGLSIAAGTLNWAAASTDLTDTADIIYEAEIDTFAELDAQVADKALVNKADGAVWLGVHDFGGADLEIPQAAPAVPAVDGGIEVDFTDGKLVMQHGSAHAELSAATDVVMGTLIQSRQGTFAFPDLLQAEIDNWPFMRVDSTEFPHGIVVTSITLTVSGDTSYAINVENWDDHDTINGANPTIDAVAYTAPSTGEVTETAITYATIAAGQIIQIDLPTTDVSWIQITMEFYEPAA